jgi:hypothetical protein
MYRPRNERARAMMLLLNVKMRTTRRAGRSAGDRVIEAGRHHIEIEKAAARAGKPQVAPQRGTLPVAHRHGRVYRLAKVSNWYLMSSRTEGRLPTAHATCMCYHVLKTFKKPGIEP